MVKLYHVLYASCNICIACNQYWIIIYVVVCTILYATRSCKTSSIDCVPKIIYMTVQKQSEAFQLSQ